MVNFSDYVDDFERFWQQEVATGPWRKRYLLAHSMGGAIGTLFLLRNPKAFDAVALCAPMFGIIIRLPDWMLRSILDWAKSTRRCAMVTPLAPDAGDRCPSASTC
ncbi:Lysophospholipase L2 [Cronobacter sakazakii 696]|nr:Lysophospholipase L2 [Cronobacter sakazakii 696]